MHFRCKQASEELSSQRCRLVPASRCQTTGSTCGSCYETCSSFRLHEHYKKRKVEKKAERKEQQALKKQRKQAEFTALTPEKQQDKRQKAQQAAKEREEVHTKMLTKLQAADEHGPKLIIDLDFWDLMNHQERKSLVSQLAFCVGHNKRAAEPCSLHFVRYVTLGGPLSCWRDHRTLWVCHCLMRCTLRCVSTCKNNTLTNRCEGSIKKYGCAMVPGNARCQIVSVANS
jgi:hypothetical protein